MIRLSKQFVLRQAKADRMMFQSHLTELEAILKLGEPFCNRRYIYYYLY